MVNFIVMGVDNSASEIEKSSQENSPPKARRTKRKAKENDVTQETMEAEIKPIKKQKIVDGEEAPAKREKKIKVKKPVEGGFDKEDIRIKANAAVHALYELLKKNEKTQLLAGTGNKLKLMITSVKLYPTQKGSIKIGLPYPYLTPELGAHIVLITPSKKGCLKLTDSEESFNYYKNILREKKIKYINEVIPMTMLKSEYIPHEMRSRLSQRCDVLLADGRIVKFIDTFLGKPFYSKKKFPVNVNLAAEDLDKEFKKALSKTYFPLNNYGTSSMVQVGISTQSAEEIICNIEAVCDKLTEKFPGHWNNIRSIYLKADDVDQGIPIHISFREHNDVRLDIERKEPVQPLVGELSTLEESGKQVAVYPDGLVKIVDSKFIKSKNIKQDEEERPTQRQIAKYLATKKGKMSKKAAKWKISSDKAGKEKMSKAGKEKKSRLSKKARKREWLSRNKPQTPIK